jgi:hypothetical protein
LDRASAEAYVVELYQEFLACVPPEAEREGWTSRLLKGAPPAAVRSAIRQLGQDPKAKRLAAEREAEARRRAAEREAEAQRLAAEQDADARRLADQREAVAQTGLFDAPYYLLTNSDVADAGTDPLDHYIQFGRAEGRAANPYLVEQWYRKRTKIRRGTDALLHYAGKGEPRGHPPGPNFDPKWYREVYRLADGESPLAHFLARRTTEPVAPCPALWSVANTPLNPAAPAGADPFLPYLAQDLAATAAADVAVLAASGLIDANHYLVANNDVTDAQLDPVWHFCVYGWKEGRNPNAYFNTRWYTETNPEVARLGVNPLVHYLLVGERADRRPVVYFEPEWYRTTNGLLEDASPLAHFLANRHQQRVSPNSLFDPEWFIANAGRRVPRRQDPFAFYLFAGTSTDLQPSATFDAVGWRRRRRGRRTRHFTELLYPDRDNPLLDYLLCNYS